MAWGFESLPQHFLFDEKFDKSLFLVYTIYIWYLLFIFIIMTTTFADIPTDLYEKEWFPEDYKGAQWHWLSDNQSQKLVCILLGEESNENISPEVLSDPDSVVVHWDIADVLGQLQPDKLHDIESWISYVVQQEKKWDLLIGQRSKQKWSWSWESTIWPYWFLENYNIISQKNEKTLPEGYTHYNLLLRVHPRHGSEDGLKHVDISAELVEIPSFSAPRVAMLMPGMVFKKQLTPDEFLDYINNYPNHILIGKAA